MSNVLHQAIPTARFWAFVNDDFVKLSLRPHQKLHHSRFSDNEEGFSLEEVSWTHNGDVVYAFWYNRARDCDGLFENWYESECDIDQLQVRATSLTDEFRFPQWRKINSDQRDHSAEAAGY